MPPELRLDVALFIHGGLAILARHPPAELRRLVLAARRIRRQKLRLLVVAGGNFERGIIPSRNVWTSLHSSLSPMNSPDAIGSSYAACRRVARQADSNFPAAFLLLPGAKRRAMDALYAFMRHSDDLVDDPAPGCSPGRGAGPLAGGRRASPCRPMLPIRHMLSVPDADRARRSCRPWRIRSGEFSHPAGASAGRAGRRGDGPLRAALRDVRRNCSLLPARGLGGRPGVHSHLGLLGPRGPWPGHAAPASPCN